MKSKRFIALCASVLCGSAPLFGAGHLAGTSANDGLDGNTDNVVFLNAGLSQIAATANGFEIQSDLILNAGYDYILEDLTFVTNNAVLTIEPGVIIRGEPQSTSGFDPGTLVISREGEIYAQGTATAPIIFTTAVTDNDGNGIVNDPASDIYTGPSDTFLDADPMGNPLAPTDSIGTRRDQLWGGVIILGESLTNVDGIGGLGLGEKYIEGLPQTAISAYGGTNPNDSSGVFSYVSIRHGGANLNANNEINGLSLGAVGYGTKIDHVEVYTNFDDGVEFFGGTVNTKFMVVTYVGDDMFDFDEGYNGIGQFWFGIFDDDGSGGDGMECDGDLSSTSDGGFVNGAALPVTYPTLYNVTMIGGTGSGGAFDCDDFFAGHILNSILVGFAAGTQIDDADSQGKFEAGDLVFAENTWWDIGDNSEGAADDNTFTSDLFDGAASGTDAYGNRIASPGFGAADIDRRSPNGVNPLPTVGAATAVNVAAGFGEPYTATFVTPVSFKGAFDTAASTIYWTTGWTVLNLSGVMPDRGDLVDVVP